ncbi:MAG: glycosyltransferase family 39 protein, partial [Elusimicrobia bacterium]|nr:glycosyltransferase family 39 protein [Elusimicrobiota bacterium]
MAALLVLAGAAFAWVRLNPDVVYLSPLGAASWIKFPRPMSLGGYAPQEAAVIFRKRFMVSRPIGASISFRALRTAELRLDGRPLLSPNDPRAWKTTSRVALSLPAGEHEVAVLVRHRGGPPALALSSAELGLLTGPDWEASGDGQSWAPAARADSYEAPEFAARFGPAAAHLRRTAPFLAVVFVVVFLWIRTGRARPSASQVRWLLLAAWTVMAANNIRTLPLACGFDVRSHMDYVLYIVSRWRLPLADEGWEMFQSPLYYLVLAPFYAITASLADVPTTLRAMRVVGLLCGAAQIELTFRALRRVYPRREDLQIMGTALGGLLPINIYLSQVVGNEPLAGALCAAAIVALWRLPSASARPTPRALVILGGLLGLALLTKVTAVLLLLPAAVFLALTLRADDARWPALGVV